MIHPNHLTLLRIALAILCSVLLLFAEHWLTYLLCFFLFVIAILTDWWDGRLARKYQLETDLGKILDPIADKILVLGVFIVMAYRSVYSIGWVIPIATREVLVTIVRMIRARRGQILSAEQAGKVKAVVQYLTLLLAYLVMVAQKFLDLSVNVLTWNFILTMALLTANLITIYSGILFFRNLKTQSI